MALMRYEPWSLLNQLHHEMDNLFRSNLQEGAAATSEWTPAVDIKEDKDGYTLYADLPGVRSEDIDINMENGVLTIQGARNTESKEELEKFKRMERVRGTFYRRFNLPDTADAEKISAKTVNGVLAIYIPKQAKVQPRRITVEG